MMLLFALIAAAHGTVTITSETGMYSDSACTTALDNTAMCSAMNCEAISAGASGYDNYSCTDETCGYKFSGTAKGASNCDGVTPADSCTGSDATFYTKTVMTCTTSSAARVSALVAFVVALLALN